MDGLTGATQPILLYHLPPSQFLTFHINITQIFDLIIIHKPSSN